MLLDNASCGIVSITGVHCSSLHRLPHTSSYLAYLAILYSCGNSFFQSSFVLFFYLIVVNDPFSILKELNLVRHLSEANFEACHKCLHRKLSDRWCLPSLQAQFLAFNSLRGQLRRSFCGSGFLFLHWSLIHIISFLTFLHYYHLGLL